MMERYSVPHAARNPDIIQDRSLTNEDPTAMILEPPILEPHGGVVRLLTEPAAWIRRGETSKRQLSKEWPV